MSCSADLGTFLDDGNLTFRLVRRPPCLILQLRPYPGDHKRRYTRCKQQEPVFIYVFRTHIIIEQQCWNMKNVN